MENKIEICRETRNQFKVGTMYYICILAAKWVCSRMSLQIKVLSSLQVLCNFCGLLTFPTLGWSLLDLVRDLNTRYFNKSSFVLPIVAVHVFIVRILVCIWRRELTDAVNSILCPVTVGFIWYRSRVPFTRRIQDWSACFSARSRNIARASKWCHRWNQQQFYNIIYCIMYTGFHVILESLLKLCFQKLFIYWCCR